MGFFFTEQLRTKRSGFFVEHGSIHLLTGDAIEQLRKLPPNSVHCVVTSPPYFGLRDYQTDGQIGLEETPEAYVQRLVDVFREVKRALHHEGTAWLNLGDSYAGFNGYSGDHRPSNQNSKTGQYGAAAKRRMKTGPNLKTKDLIGIPWMTAFALRADGWYLRRDIIWAKKSYLPENVQDRPTTSHEYIFQLSKSAQYFFDPEPVRNAPTGRVEPMGFGHVPERTDKTYMMDGSVGSNVRSVWSFAPKPFMGEHFASFPPELPQRCILAGTSQHGVCARCGAPWRRIVRAGEDDAARQAAAGGDSLGGYSGQARKRFSGAKAQNASDVKRRILAGMKDRQTAGWQPGCNCDADVVPAVVLDPFSGTGTTAIVAAQLGRHGIGIDLNASYNAMAAKRAEREGLDVTIVP